MVKYNQKNQKQKDELIEIVDNTDKTSNQTGNQNIKLKPNNKTTLINRNKVINDVSSDILNQKTYLFVNLAF